jgi:hypothetical protein
VLPSLGVQFQNQLSGAFRLQTEESAERPARLELKGQVPNLFTAIFATRVSLQGTISLSGFADEKPLTGELELYPLRSLRLRLQFPDNQGAGCSLEAAKDFDVGETLRGKAEVAATLRGQDGAELGLVRLEVDLLQSFGQLWGSLRPTAS